jgi:hypothetical protein
MVRLAFPVLTEALAVLSVMSLPHVLYYWIWRHTDSFKRTAKALRIPGVDFYLYVSVIR